MLKIVVYPLFFAAASFAFIRTYMISTCFTVETAKQYHRYVQQTTTLMFLFCELAVASTCYFLYLQFVGYERYWFIFSALHNFVMLVQCAVVVLFSKQTLLQWFYRISPARRELMKTSYMNENARDKALQVLVFMLVFLLPLLNVFHCLHLVIKFTTDTGPKEIGPFVGISILAAAVNNLFGKPSVQSNTELQSPLLKRQKGHSSLLDQRFEKTSEGDPISVKGVNKNNSALHENIRAKGKHSYYYAHGNTRSEELNRGEAPKLLSKKRIQNESNDSSSRHYLKAVKTYAFIDKQSTIRIYINRSQFQDSADKNMPTIIDWEEESVTLYIGTTHVLCLPNLTYKISGASTQYGKTKLVLILQKEDTSKTWESLQR